jgi:prepilin-type processing-associated H-X9-DG protein
MKPRGAKGFTKCDLAIVIGTVAILVIFAGLMLPWMSSPRPRASRVNCVSNLKQIGLGFRMWSNEHGDRFPWQVPAAEGGTKEFANIPMAALHFIVVSNEFNSPKILICSADTNKVRTNTWQGPLHLNLSYFAGLDGDETKPQTILSGDRNVSTNSDMLTGLITVQNEAQVRWTKDIHQHKGNIGLADGSVAQTSTDALRKVFRSALDVSSNAPLRLILP